MMKRRLAIILFLSFLASGCGYTTRSQIIKDYKTIYVEPVINKIDIAKEQEMAKFQSYRPMLESQIIQQIVDRFLTDGNLKPVSDKDQADIILKTELIDFRRSVLKYKSDDEPDEYRLSIGINFALWNNHNKELLWEEKNFYGESTYFISGSTNTSESIAVDKAIKDLARRVVERIIEEW